MRDFPSAVLAGVALVIFSLGLYSLAPDDPVGGYALMPGLIVGFYASVFASGNPHGGQSCGFCSCKFCELFHLQHRGVLCPEVVSRKFEI
jgi:hypothetical protein